MTVGVGVMEIGSDAVAVMLLASVIVTEYNPAAAGVGLGMLGFCMEEAKPLGPAQFQPTAAPPVSFSTKVLVPAHRGALLLTITTGAPCPYPLEAPSNKAAVIK